MARLTRTWICLLLLALPAAAAQTARADYEVDVTRPESNRVRVTMSVPAEGAFQVSLPSWAPGAYRIVKYAQQVRGLAASDADGRPLKVEVVDEQTWRVEGSGGGTVALSYEVVTEALRFDREHCLIPGPETFLYVVGRKDLPCRVRFVLPAGWKVGTGLDALPDGAYGARDYDTFIDCPVELGRFELVTFEADGARYELVIHAKGPVNGAALAEMCRKTVKEQNRIFGAPPFERYVFLFHFRDGSGGRGLEHLNSTDIGMPYQAIKAEPLLAASITSHEYFHLWNVKRIRPVELGPFDYTKIVRTKALWFCEGVTSYYGDRSLVRAGIWKEQAYLDHLAGEIETLQNNPDRKKTSVEQASWSVWDRKDWPRVDYYNKGELLGLLLDLRIRVSSEGGKSLDDVLRLLMARYVTEPAAKGKGPIGVGFPEDGILRAVEEVAGGEWDDFFKRYMGGTEELPYGEVLGLAGLSPQLVVSTQPDLGVDLRGTLVANVATGSAAEKAGFKVGDRLILLGDAPLTRTNLRELVGKLEPGTQAELKVLRGADTVPLSVPVGTRERTSCKVKKSEVTSPLQARILRAWLQAVRDF